MSLVDIDMRGNTEHAAVAADVHETADEDLEDRAARLKRMINVAPSYTAALSWWTGLTVRRTARVPDTRREADELEATLLDVPPGTRVTVRDGHLVPALGDSTVRLAAVTALVYESALRLDLDGSAALREGSVPLGELLGAAVHRATQVTVRVAGPVHPDAPVLYSQARLLLAGRPVAVVTETTYWCPLLRRAPATMPRYVQADPWPTRPGRRS
ncbi:hypothetical protein [Saccharothrix xinjiangensis]|uniref:UTRA domain-containing protein n=1 Tax=Saccharothrix xinjiangensis TaxID=204798 RepID=A0ABV9XXV7_9PSEU